MMLRLFLVIFLIGMSIPAFAATSETPRAQPQYLFQLTYADAEAAIGKALAERGAAEKVTATINGGKQGGALFSYDKPLSVEIRGLQFDKGTRRWSASLLFISNEEVVSAIPTAGRFDEAVDLPVLKRQVRNGEVIGQDDIEIRSFLLNRTRTDSITDSAVLIGKSPSRTISPARPIREHEIASPAIVKKNGIVQMRYSNAAIEIITTGQAMADGARGDVIDVRNIDSKKIVRAVIENENLVNIIGSDLQAQSTGASYAAN